MIGVDLDTISLLTNQLIVFHIVMQLAQMFQTKSRHLKVVHKFSVDVEGRKFIDNSQLNIVRSTQGGIGI